MAKKAKQVAVLTQNVPDEILDQVVNGNHPEANAPAEKTTVDHPLAHAKREFAKTSHLCAHRIAGANNRYLTMYLELGDKVYASWCADIKRAEADCARMYQYNQAGATTKKDRLVEMCTKMARETMATVFAEWRMEVDRIIENLNGWKQEDGQTVVFPDGSTKKLPKGLFIPPERKITFEATVK